MGLCMLADNTKIRTLLCEEPLADNTKISRKKRASDTMVLPLSFSLCIGVGFISHNFPFYKTKTCPAQGQVSITVNLIVYKPGIPVSYNHTVWSDTILNWIHGTTALQIYLRRDHVHGIRIVCKCNRIHCSFLSGQSPFNTKNYIIYKQQWHVTFRALKPPFRAMSVIPWKIWSKYT